MSTQIQHERRDAAAAAIQTASIDDDTDTMMMRFVDFPKIRKSGVNHSNKCADLSILLQVYIPADIPIRQREAVGTSARLTSCETIPFLSEPRRSKYCGCVERDRADRNDSIHSHTGNDSTRISLRLNTMTAAATRLLSRSASSVIASGLPRQVAIVGASGLVKRGKKTTEEASSQSPSPPSTTAMIGQVMQQALHQAELSTQDLDGLVAVPSLQGDHFMEAHFQATALGLFGNGQEPRALRCRTLDTGGAGPVSALLEAERMIQAEGLECVAVVAADAVGSMSSEEFLSKADDIFFKLGKTLGQPDGSVQSPAIPHGYDRITQYQMQHYGLTRRQLQMVPSLESFHASLHPSSLQSQKSNYTIDSEQAAEPTSTSKYPRRYYSAYTSLEQVQSSPPVTSNISLLECARRADGAACLILASNRFLQRKSLWSRGTPVVIGGGAFSGPLYPPLDPDRITDAMYASSQQAMDRAFASAGNLTAKDIHFFGLYDCFPICLVRAIEACGLAPKGQGGTYLETQYQRLIDALEMDGDDTTSGSIQSGGAVESLLSDPSFFPINTHGGLLCYGAPWEVPAMFNIIEAVDQLRGQAQGRQIQDCRRALVFGNGGVLSASAVAILAKSN